MEALTLLVDKPITRIENKENKDLINIYDLFYDVYYLISFFVNVNNIIR